MCLARAPAGQAKQLWLTSQGQRRLAGILAVDAQDISPLVFDDAAQLTRPSEGATPAGLPVVTWQTSGG